MQKLISKYKPVYSYSTYPDRRFSSRYHNILKMSPPFASSEGYRLVVIATRAMMRDERHHSVILSKLTSDPWGGGRDL